MDSVLFRFLFIPRGPFSQLGTNEFYSSFKRPTATLVINTPLAILMGFILFSLLSLFAFYLISNKRSKKVQKTKLGRMGEYYLALAPTEKRPSQRSVREIIGLYTSNQRYAAVLKEILQCTRLEPQQVLDDPVQFEYAVSKFLRLPTFSASKLPLIPGIRNQLNFMITNPTVDFISTKQIPKGYKMRASFPNQKKRMSFITALFGATEKEFAIIPPRRKGEPADISRFQLLSFILYNPDGAEFKFESPIIGQQKAGRKLVVMGHSAEIQKLVKRKFKRYAVNLETHILPVQRGQTENVYVPANILDLSRGGVKVKMGNNGLALNPNYLFKFDISQAEIEDLTAIPTTLELKDNQWHLSLKFHETSEVNRMLIDRFIEVLEEDMEKKETQEAAPANTSKP